MLHFWETHWGQLMSALLYSLIGIGMFALAFTVLRKMMPFNVYKELEEDQNIALGIVIAAVFIGGAITTTLLIHWARRRHMHSEFALSLLLEALLLLAFGLLGANLAHTSALLVPATAAVLCFIMGLQNAVITKISNAEIRTTHVTGLVTDLGIELGKLFYINRLTREKLVKANRKKLGIHFKLITSFFVGGLAGALGFKAIGFVSTLPLAMLLLLLVWRPVLNDARNWIDPHHPEQDH